MYAAESVAPTSRPGVPLSVLLVDDDSTDLELAAIVFGEHALDVQTCAGGVEALAHLRATPSLPHVIVLDLNMPQMNGFEVLTSIRRDEGLRHLPVVILSTSGEARDVTRAYDLLASSYMVKQRDFAAFEEQVRGFVSFWTSCVFPADAPTPS